MYDGAVHTALDLDPSDAHFSIARLENEISCRCVFFCLSGFLSKHSRFREQTLFL